MIEHNLEQGSIEWHLLRAEHLTASNAPSMMGEGYDSRDAAMQYALGIKEKEITPFMQNIFDQGHQAEAEARPVASKYLGEELEPVVGTLSTIDGLDLLASYDGITPDRKIVWEHKNTNKMFVTIPALYYWQMEHQMLVADCEEALLTTTNRETGDIMHHHYISMPERRQALIEGWIKWLDDLANYQRSDDEWIEAAELYLDLKEVLTSLTRQEKAAKERLQELAGNRSAHGAGVKVSVTRQWVAKQTPAAYIKEHKIDLPETTLDEPKLNYRVTLEK